MKEALPGLRKKLNSNPTYFKKVYMHTFDLCKAPGARSLTLETGKLASLSTKLTPALDMWNLFIPPALASSPSALSKLPPGAASSTQTDEAPAFDGDDLEMWLEFQRERGKAISKDTWSLFIDFLRTIDKQYKEYDEEGELTAAVEFELTLQLRGRRRSTTSSSTPARRRRRRDILPGIRHHQTNDRYPFPPFACTIYSF